MSWGDQPLSPHRPQLRPLCVCTTHGTSFPSFIPPSPYPRYSHPPHSLLLRAVDPTQSCAEALAGLGWPWTEPGGQVTLARFEQGPGPHQPREASEGRQPSHPLPLGEVPASAPWVTGQAELHRVGGTGAGGDAWCGGWAYAQGQRGPGLKEVPRGPQPEPRQLAVGGSCAQHIWSSASVGADLASLPWPKFPITPGPAGPFRIKLIQCKRGRFPSQHRQARRRNSGRAWAGGGVFPVPGGK